MTNKKQQTVGCRVAVESSNESLHAHVLLGNNMAPDAGDAVLVHGEEIDIAFGERQLLRRTATLTRANPITRAWTKFIAIFEITGLYEVSFSGRKKP